MVDQAEQNAPELQGKYGQVEPRLVPELAAAPTAQEGAVYSYDAWGFLPPATSAHGPALPVGISLFQEV